MNSHVPMSKHFREDNDEMINSNILSKDIASPKADDDFNKEAPDRSRIKSRHQSQRAHKFRRLQSGPARTVVEPGTKNTERKRMSYRQRSNPKYGSQGFFNQDFNQYMPQGQAFPNQQQFNQTYNPNANKGPPLANVVNTAKNQNQVYQQYFFIQNNRW